MAKKVFFTAIVLLIYTRIGFSQTKPDSVYRDFGLSIAINDFQIKDKVLNPIRYTGTFPALGFSYQWSQPDIRQRVELDMIVNMLKSRYENEHSPVTIDLSLNYRQVRKLTELKPDLHLFLGGVAGFYSHMSYFEKWDDSHIYWLTYYYLGFNGLLTYGDPSGSSAYLEIGLPLISLVSRPPERFLYKVINNEFSWIVSEIHNDLTLTTIDRHFALQLDFGYLFKHSASFSQKVFWRLAYTNTDMSYSKEVTFMINMLGTVLLF